MRRVTFVSACSWLQDRAENIACLMLAIMFVAFILQIMFRYWLNLPTGWTNELSVVLWIWLVLFGSAFVTRERDEVRFDLIYSMLGKQGRRGTTLACAAVLVALFTVSLPAVLDYVTFMKVEKSAYLGIRFDYLYSIYGVFAVAMIARYLWLAWHAVWGRARANGGPVDAEGVE